MARSKTSSSRTSLPRQERLAVRASNFDFERFSLSSKETYLTGTLEIEKHSIVSWPLLKIYYSGFFAAHAIMRSRGCGIVKIDKAHTDHVNQIATIYDPNFLPLQAGMYRYRIGPSSTNRVGKVSVTLNKAPQGSGVHEAFWIQFCSFIEAEATKASMGGRADAALFIAGAVELSDAITTGGSGSGAWLSAVRNEVNYQHKHGAWFPTVKSSSAMAAFVDGKLPTLATVRLNIPKRKDKIGAFVNTAAYVSCLSFAVSAFVAERSTAGRAFGQKWRRLDAQFNA